MMNQKSEEVDSLNRIVKTKIFFESQSELDEEMIFIPRWYHATKLTGFHGIVQGKNIEVRHEQAYKGAWVSSQREGSFGGYVFSLSNKISRLSSGVFIGFEYVDRKWRGVQQAIPLPENLGMVGIPRQENKTSQKINKLKIIQVLEKGGFPQHRVFSSEQLDFIQRLVMEILGMPNLPDQWWGK